MNRPFIWAHRGASAVAPENTMAAFCNAVDAGADGLELDIHLTRDKVPVVIHDDTLDRTTDGRGRVAGYTVRELRNLDAGRWFDPSFSGERIPLLEEVLELFSSGIRLNLEVKDAEAGLAVVDLMRQHECLDAVLSSFDRRLLRDLRRADPEVPLAVLLDRGDWHRALSLADQLNAVSFHPRADLAFRPMLAAAAGFSLPVYCWTVDSPTDARRLFRAGVDGLFTNDPKKIMTMLADAG